MKTRLSPLFAVTAICLAAPTLWAVTPFHNEDFSDPLVWYRLGHENGSLRMGFEEIPANGPLPAVGLGSFDLLHANGGGWQWRSLNGSTTITAMDLSDDGVVRYYAPAVSSHIRWLEINPSGSITFGPQTSGGVARSLSIDGAKLKWDNIEILTKTDSDARYLRVDLNRLQFGSGSVAGTDYAIAMGKGTRATGLGAVALGAAYEPPDVVSPLSATGKGATALGYGSQSWADGATAIGFGTRALAQGGVALGEGSLVNHNANSGVSIGYRNIVRSSQSIALGGANEVDAINSLAVGWFNHVYSGGLFSFAAGNTNRTHAEASLAIGFNNDAYGEFSSAIGRQNKTYGWGALAVGLGNRAEGAATVALGAGTLAYGRGAFAAGESSQANKEYATALGYYTEAHGQASTAIGYMTKAIGPNQLVIGSYNEPVVDPNGAPGNPHDAAFIVGNGYATTNTATPPVTTITRRNALVVRWNGNVEASGKITAAPGTDGGITVPATIKAVNGKVLVPASGDIGMGDFNLGDQP